MKINGEECKSIPGFSRYVISESARIYRVVALINSEIKIQNNSPEKLFAKESKVQYFKERIRGRWTQVGLVNDKNKFTTASAEKLLCNAFNLWSNPKKTFSIDFKDGNSNNIHINNIITAPHKPNNSKLDEDDVKTIKKRIANGETLRKIADDYGVSDMQICRIKSGENWRKGGRIKPIPQAPFKIKDGKLRRFLSSFDFVEIDENIRRPFTIKRTDDPTNNKIIGVVNGFRLSKSHKNISRARALVFNLNKHFFTEDIAIKINSKFTSKEEKQPTII